MVAISLYKGNLHKTPDVPHRWPRPTPKISLKDFKTLLRRRDRALCRLHSTDVATTSNPNPAPASNSSPNCVNTDRNGSSGGNHVDNPCSERELIEKTDLKEGEVEKEEGKATDERLVKGDDSLKKLVEESDTLMEQKNEETVKNDEKADAPLDPAVENISTETAIGDVEKRKKEVKDKLEILNEKKHSLVQVLKQILNAEEQLKRQNSVPGMSGRPPLPLQVDTTTDSGSMTRVNTPRMVSDGNACGDIEGGEADDVSNHNMHTRHLPRLSSTSPSSDSQLRKPASNTVPHSYRTTLAVAVGSPSPSRFAHTAHGPPSVSGSGASYIASTPSPAASGGTSVFRDARLPSPWN